MRLVRLSYHSQQTNHQEEVALVITTSLNLSMWGVVWDQMCHRIISSKIVLWNQ